MVLKEKNTVKVLLRYLERVDGARHAVTLKVSFGDLFGQISLAGNGSCQDTICGREKEEVD